MLNFLTHPLLDIPCIKHGFFSRKGGVSHGKYASLNTGEGSDDDKTSVAENRRRVAAAFDITPDRLLSLHQIHSADAVLATNLPIMTSKADGLVTTTPDLAISALSADCAPVLFADPKTYTIGACHAGWRGALAGVTDATLDLMVQKGAKPENIRAVIGPCISVRAYEVGEDFRDNFLSNNPDNSRYFEERRSENSDSYSLYFDIKKYLLSRLRAKGLSYIDAIQDCTYSQPELYFSYRYNTHNDISDYGRNISVIMRT